jgi:hypothetical protein
MKQVESTGISRRRLLAMVGLSAAATLCRRQGKTGRCANDQAGEHVVRLAEADRGWRPECWIR